MNPVNNTKNSPWTNGVGILLIVLSSFLYVAEHFFELKSDVNDTHLAIIAGIGLVVLLGFSDEAFKIALDFFKDFLSKFKK